VHGGTVSAWRPASVTDIKLADLTLFNEKPPEVLLIGTGRTTVFPAALILQALKAAHIGFECMDSRAAARTYNILIGEGRDVSVAMLLPGAN